MLLSSNGIKVYWVWYIWIYIMFIVAVIDVIEKHWNRIEMMMVVTESWWSERLIPIELRLKKIEECQRGKR